MIEFIKMQEGKWNVYRGGSRSLWKGVEDQTKPSLNRVNGEAGDVLHQKIFKMLIS